MPPETGASPIAALIEAVRRRRAFLDGGEAFAVACAVAAASGWLAAGLSRRPVGWVAGVCLGVLAGVGLFSTRRRDHTAAVAAAALERISPNSRNLIVTAEELARHPERSNAWMRERIERDAARAAAAVTAADAVSAKRPLALAGGAAILVLAVLILPTARETVGTAAALGQRAADAVLGRTPWTLRVTVQPPAYAKLENRTLVDPERLEVLEGTRLTLGAGDAASVRVRFGTTALGQLSGGGSLVHVARDSGYFAIETADAPVRLVALSVVRDRTPTVKIEQPARDLLLPNAARAIPLRVTAADDLGLVSLELRYTKVSGSGENFEFQEGTLPLALTRGSDRDWRAQGQMALASLNLSPGDSLVYRAVARDARAGEAGLGASDTYFVEIAGPGQVPLEGVEMPPEEERYALSQQMIVLKIERLKAREKTMAREAVVEETALLAAEQRSVRANFIFLLGGHVEDEEEEAEQSSEIAEGRLQNTARRDIARAISHMTRAEEGLVAVNASNALPPARAAVEALQRAFGRSRYLLRSLASRTRLDPSRRLTGNISTAGDWRRALLEPPPREGNDVRVLLADVVAAYKAIGSSVPSNLASLAERALAVDPTSSRWQAIAAQIQRATAAQGPVEAQQLLETVIGELTTAAGVGLVPSAGGAAPPPALERAWRRGGGR